MECRSWRPIFWYCFLSWILTSTTVVGLNTSDSYGKVCACKQQHCITAKVCMLIHSVAATVAHKILSPRKRFDAVGNSMTAKLLIQINPRIILRSQRFIPKRLLHSRLIRQSQLLCSLASTHRAHRHTLVTHLVEVDLIGINCATNEFGPTNMKLCNDRVIERCVSVCFADDWIHAFATRISNTWTLWST